MRKYADELAELGYPQRTQRGGVERTDRGVRAAQTFLTFDAFVHRLGLDEDDPKPWWERRNGS
jgi:Mn-dependent DtxR family transcriptional regulator